MDELDEQLLRAHAHNDGPLLVKLYTEAGDRCEAVGDIDAACFYLTHAFVFALEQGAAEATALNNRLHRHGRVHLMEQEAHHAQ